MHTCMHAYMLSQSFEQPQEELASYRYNVYGYIVTNMQAL